MGDSGTTTTTDVNCLALWTFIPLSDWRLTGSLNPVWSRRELKKLLSLSVTCSETNGMKFEYSSELWLMSPTWSPLKTDFKISCSNFFLDDLHNSISRSAYRLHVLVFHICLYNFPFFCQSQSYFRWTSFSKWRFIWVFRSRSSRENTLVDL